MYSVSVVSTTLFLSGADGMGYRVRSSVTGLVVTCVLFLLCSFRIFYVYLPVGCCAERGEWSELIRLQACIIQTSYIFRIGNGIILLRWLFDDDDNDFQPGA